MCGTPRPAPAGSSGGGGPGGPGSPPGSPGGGGGASAPVCSGTLVLDPTSKPNWKIACNVCHHLVRFEGLHSVAVAKGVNGGDRPKCDLCGANLLAVEFHKSASPFGPDCTRYEGCVLCDELLHSVSVNVRGRRRHVKLSRGRGRRKGGRGRGGRRGGGRDAPSTHKDKMSFDGF